MGTVENGPMAMYHLKPYYSDSFKGDLPDCMYKMKTYHGAEDNAMDTEVVDPAVAELEKRQKDILQRLGKLQKQVAELVTKAPMAKPGSKPMTVTSIQQTQSRSKQLITELQDIVINACPSSPPLSLFILTEMLSQQLKVLATSHVHSSVKDMPDQLGAYSSNNGIVIARNEYRLIITVIWKEVKCPILMVSPQKHTPLMGEATVARYLARLLSPAYDEGDITDATEIDSWLDCATQLLKGNSKEKGAVTRTLNSRLGKNSWLVGNDLSLADIVMWSALLQSGNNKSASGNVKKWMEQCSQNPAFQKVAKLVS